MENYTITYKSFYGNERTDTVRAEGMSNAQYIADRLYGSMLVSVTPEVKSSGGERREESKEKALLELLILESRFSLEKQKHGFVDFNNWKEYNSALDKMCELLDIDPVDFAEMLEAELKLSLEKNPI